MNETSYKNRLERYLERKGVSVSESELETCVDHNFGKQPPSVAVHDLMPSFSKRATNRERATAQFDEVLEAACDLFQQNKSDAKKNIDDENWRDLRSAACFIGLHILKIRPSISIAEAFGLLTPAAVYTCTYRAEKLLKERVLFKMAVDQIVLKLPSSEPFPSK
jgi:hypothetical protein